MLTLVKQQLFVASAQCVTDLNEKTEVVIMKFQ